MDMQQLFDDASRWMTALSFATFIGILWWTFFKKQRADFDAAAALPFADEAAGAGKGEAADV